MKELIIKRLEKIKFEEDGFKSKWWKNNFVSYTQNNIIETKILFEVDFNLLNDDDLVRLFEYVILCRNDISNRRTLIG